tara:strand:- start:204 stop:491 length:288 start_codon:yes stop_codon:yes gene_type:complete
MNCLLTKNSNQYQKQQAEHKRLEDNAKTSSAPKKFLPNIAIIIPNRANNRGFLYVCGCENWRNVKSKELIFVLPGHSWGIEILTLSDATSVGDAP